MSILKFKDETTGQWKPIGVPFEPTTDVYTKEETLSDETKTSLELDKEATPNDAFNKLNENIQNALASTETKALYELPPSATNDDIFNKLYASSNTEGISQILFNLTGGFAFTIDPKYADTSYNFEKIVYGDNKWVGLRASHIYESIDGKEWNEIETVGNQYIRALGYHNGLWVAITHEDGANSSQNGKYHVITSSDAKNWTRKATFEGNERYISADHVIDFKNNMWMIVSIFSSGRNKGLFSITSQDGVNWSKGSDFFNFTNGVEIENVEIIYGNNTWGLSGFNLYGIYSKNNGSTWESYHFSGEVNPPIFVKFGGGVFYAYRKNVSDSIYTSTDYIRWTNAYPLSGTNMSLVDDIEYENGRWMALSGYREGIATSTNGSTWTKLYESVGENSKLSYGNDIWVVFDNEAIVIINQNLQMKKVFAKTINEKIVFNNKIWLAKKGYPYWSYYFPSIEEKFQAKLDYISMLNGAEAPLEVV